MLTTKSVKTVYSCCDFSDDLHRVFQLAGPDDKSIHPTHFCHACKVVVDKSESSHYSHRTTVFEHWGAHTEGHCTVCLHYQALQRGGRPKKTKRSCGRPPTSSPRYCIDRVQEVAPPFLILPDKHFTTCDVHQHFPISELNCPLCCDILNQPIELVTCGAIVCAECMHKWLKVQNHLACPCCYTDHLKDFSTIRQAPSLVVTAIRSLCVVCEQCTSHMQLWMYQEHTCTPQAVSPNTSIEDVLEQPLSAPLTPIEQKLQTSLARRSMTGEKVLHLKTGGKVR